ncbi:MAG TPA: MFS transporter [Solirubrobacteraceae bacterium]|nr:MFS transporter [Solirubrobacteraceae bacterium]
MTRALRVGSFRRLLVSYGLNELTWSFGTIALAVLIYRRTGSALGSTAFFLCSQFAPALFSPLLVARLGGVDHRRVLPLLYAVEAGLFGVLAAMATQARLVPILAVTLLDGIIALSARTISRTATVDVLRPLDLLHEGNALINVVFSVCYMVGPAIGGVVVAAGGTVSSLLVNCGLFAVIALVLALTALPAVELHEEDRGRSALGRLRAAVDHARHDRAIGRLLLLQTFGMVMFTISIPVEVVFAQHSVHAGAGGYGAMLSGWGAGAVAGSAAYARWRRARGNVLLAVSGTLLAFGFAVIAAAPTITLAVVGSALGGAGNGSGGIAIRTMLQEYTPQRWMSLITSLLESLGQAAPGLGFVLGGVLSSVADPRVALAVAGAGSLVYAGAAGWGLRLARIGAPPPAFPPGPAPAAAVGPERVSGAPAGSG